MNSRPRGHVKPKESASEWERTWISIYSGDGYGYRLIASLVYGITPLRVTDGEMGRVGRLARQMRCGCNGYRTGKSERARENLGMLHASNRSNGPPEITPALLKVLKKK